MLDDGALRIGSEEYFTAHGSRGLATLQCRDATVDGDRIRLVFPAKSGRRLKLEFEDPDLAPVLAELVCGRSRAPLFA
jgi:DNA topoisomerase-1